MTPDLPTASGGIQVLYAIVEALNANGIAACVWHGAEGHRYSSFSSEAPVVHGLAQDLAPGDVLVMQEVGGPKWNFMTQGQPVVMLVQGHTFLFDGLDFKSRLPAGYPGWPNARAAIVVSEYVERTVHGMAGAEFPTFRIPPSIDPALFVPRRKQRTIAYMPRRRRDDLVAVVQLLDRGSLLPDGWTFTEIDGLDQAGVAAQLGQSAIFLSGARREGFGMTGAEALSAGCAVVGFTGDGGAEYLTSDVARVIHDNDFVGMAQAVAETARRYDAADEDLRNRTMLGRARVHERYSPEKLRDSAVAAFQELEAAGSDARVTTPTRITHYQTHAPRSGAGWAIYLRARRLARRGLNAVRGTGQP